MRHLDEGTLQAWLDRDRSGLSASERTEIERHLEACAACARRLEEMEELSTRAEVLLGTRTPKYDAMPTYAELVARADRHRAAGRRRSAWTAGGWAASVAVALGVGWMANDLYRAAPVPPAMEERVGASAAAATPPTEAPTRVPAQPPAGAAPRTDLAERAAPATPALVRGRVTDGSGRPLAAAQVVVDGTHLGTLTRDDGTFTISLEGMPTDSAIDEVTVTAQLIGFKKESRALAVRGSDVAPADFRLEPQALALDQIVVTGAAAPGVTSGPQEVLLAPGGDERAWTVTSRAEAEERAGFRLVTVPDLRVIRIQVEETADVTLVRVVQELGEGNVLDLVEGRGTLRFDATAPEDGRSRATIRRGGVSVAAAAPVTMDALRALLERVR